MSQYERALGPTGQRFCLQPQPQATQIVYQQKWLARWAEKFSALVYDDPGRCPGLGEPRAFGPDKRFTESLAYYRPSLIHNSGSLFCAGTCLLLPSPNESLSPDREHAYPQFRRVKAHHPAACLAAAFVAWLAVLTAALADGPIVLRDVTKQTGIDFRHTDGSQRPAVHRRNRSLGAGDVRLRRRRTDRHLLPQRPAALPGAKADVPPQEPPLPQPGRIPLRGRHRQAGVGDARLRAGRLRGRLRQRRATRTST